MAKDSAVPQPAAKLIELQNGEVFRLKAPMELPARPGGRPAFSGSVNSYLIRAPKGRWVIVDPGLYTATGIAGWKMAIDLLQIAPADVERILVTHYHSDHAGMAGWFGAWTSAPVHMHPADTAAFAVEWGDRKKNVSDTIAQMRAYGMDGPSAALAERQTEERTRFICPYEGFAPLADGDLVPVCEGALQVLHVPGHTDGQCALLWPERRLLFAADLLLPVTFSPVCLHHFGDPDPVGTFLHTLTSFQRLDLSGYTVLPGHGWPFEDPLGRAALESRFYQERAEWCRAQCAQGLDTAWKIAKKLHREGGGKRYLRSIMWETMAHVEYLARNGRLTRQIRSGRIYFSA